MLWTSMRSFSENFLKNYWQQLEVKHFLLIFQNFFLILVFKVRLAYFCPKTLLECLLQHQVLLDLLEIYFSNKKSKTRADRGHKPRS